MIEIVRSVTFGPPNAKSFVTAVLQFYQDPSKENYNNIKLFEKSLNTLEEKEELTRIEL